MHTTDVALVLLMRVLVAFVQLLFLVLVGLHWCSLMILRQTWFSHDLDIKNVAGPREVYEVIYNILPVLIKFGGLKH